MVHPWVAIYGFVLLWITFNAILIPFIKKKTNYSLNKTGDNDEGPIFWLFLFCGPFMLLFLKQIRLYRKHRYLKLRIQYYKFSHMPISLNDIGISGMQPEIDKLERIYKISKIHQQSRRNKIKKKILCR